MVPESITEKKSHVDKDWKKLEEVTMEAAEQAVDGWVMNVVRH